MTVNINKVFFGGNLTRDPVVTTSKSGKQIVKFGVACNEWAGKDKPDRVTFADVTAFGARGMAIANNLKKGDPILIEGRLDFSKWTTAVGEPRSKLAIVLDQFHFVGGRAESASSGSSEVPF